MAGVTIEGVVEHGRRLGRELGFPTANMAVPDSVTAADGVYYSRAEVDGTLYDAMSNLGSNPSSAEPSAIWKPISSGSEVRSTAVRCAWNWCVRSVTNVVSRRSGSCGRRSPGTRNIYWN